MEISSRFVGAGLKALQKEVLWRDTMNYAAAVEDGNPLYFDDEAEVGVMAPPLFAVSLTWSVTGQIWDYLEADDFPLELLHTMVHYTEHLAFHHPVRPGDRLTIKGNIAAILPHPSGTHLVLRYQATDQKGKPVFTEHTGALLRGVTCTDAGRGGEDLPGLPNREGEGAPLWKSRLSIDPLRPYIYDGCTDIFFPIHTSRQFARQVGLPGIILQGTATLAYAARELVNRSAKGDARRLKALYCRFTGMVRPGSDIEVSLLGQVTGAAGNGLFYQVANQEGKRVLSSGFASILPE